ncbi:hypothetical protein HJG60_008955 [Phyllostomus discolor]|uniref:Uncharacterized protein n=1 Tax=Phyllostomus discolor TaxID=89673 RepID=A0A833YSY5_9CHIR|nr:hypothetical protein HJG60_008955 [Phyllostomus discolor]
MKQGRKVTSWECWFCFGFLPLKWILLAAGRAGWTFDSHTHPLIPGMHHGPSRPSMKSQSPEAGSHHPHPSPQCDPSARLAVVSVLTRGFASCTFFCELLFASSSKKSALGMFKTPEGTDHDY